MMGQESTLAQRSPSPIAEEADEDDDSSSAFGQTIRRIMERAKPSQQPQLRLTIPPSRLRRMQMGQRSSGEQPAAPSFSSQLGDSKSVDEQQQQQQSACAIDVLPTKFSEPTTQPQIHVVQDYADDQTTISSMDDDNSSQYGAGQQPRDHLAGQEQTSSAYNETTIMDDAVTASSDNQTTFEFRLYDDRAGAQVAPPLAPAPPFARRYFGSSYSASSPESKGRLAKRHRKDSSLEHHSSFDSINNLSDVNFTQMFQGSTLLSNGGADTAPTSALAGADDADDLETKWSWKNLKREFRLSHSESLFHLYQAKLQQSFFVALLILNIIFNLGAIGSYAVSKFHKMNICLIIMRASTTCVFVLFLMLIWFNKNWMQSKFSRTCASLAVLNAMIFGEASGAICALVNDQATPLASIRRTYYLIITNHVFLPFPTRIQSCAATIIITSFEIVVTYISRRDNLCRADYLTLYSVADIIFYATSAMIGFQITFLLEIAIRRTFLNHKYCIQSTYKLNYEKEQQEQLLLSCFPQHLIEQIRGEIRDSLARFNKRQSQPFKPFNNLYVEKYENVTILYADIVNSMNLTDKLNSAELVETLNELYGRFDELAEKQACLRIKLLGDCYYCVCGLPEYDQDHAIKCLLMGLGMIKIIQSIRQTRNVDIDMRIGIHSGSVLSGLLGLRKWQFDIWSLDAMEASKMEHNGQPGFVHITQRTLDLIPKDRIEQENLIITAARQSDDSETTYLISERICDRIPRDTASLNVNGQTEKLKAYIEKLRLRTAANAVDFTQRRMALESSLKKYREIHEKVDETMKTAIADMPLGSWLLLRAHNLTHRMDLF